MNRSLSCLFVGVVMLSPSPAQGQATNEYLRTNPQFLQAFREVVQPASQSIVRVRCDGVDTCQGVVAGADGWILTKAHDLTGKITCQLKDGQEFAARLVGVHEAHDLAMLRVAASRLRPIAWSDSESLRAGSWVASVGPGDDPVAIGVVSVPTRRVHEAYLGAEVEESPSGLLVLNIMQNSAALKAGVRPKDVIMRVNGQTFTDPESFSRFLGGYKPGDTITLTIYRGETVRDVHAALQSREQRVTARGEMQNRMGSELSSRRSGYAVILQHDSVIKPGDCGGPLVDLRGRVIGINISRAGRVESWAIPAEVIRPLIADLQSGRLAPRGKRFQ